MAIENKISVTDLDGEEYLEFATFKRTKKGIEGYLCRHDQK